MKTKVLSYFALLAVATTLGSCSDDQWNNDIKNVDGEGRLNVSNLQLAVSNAEIIISDTPSAKVQSRSTIDLSNYIVTVTNNNTGAVAAEWTYSSMPSLPTFAVGNYTLTVESHKVQPVAWDAPYFRGSETFQITNGNITSVESVLCKLANIRVSVNFDENLLAKLSGDVNVTVTSSQGTSATFTATETRSAYFAAVENMTTLEVHFQGVVSGTNEDFVSILTGVEAGQYRKVTFSYRENTNTTPPTGQFGNDGEGVHVETTVVKVDYTANTPLEETVETSTDRPNQEGGEQGGGDNSGTTEPEVSAITMTSATLDMDNVNNCSDFGPGIKDAIVNIHADKGIQKIHVKIDSSTLTPDELESVGLESEFDLDNPGSLEGSLTNLGLPVGDAVVGKTDVEFNITNFMPLLNMLGAGDHRFVLTVTDMDGNVKEAVLKVKSLGE